MKYLVDANILSEPTKPNPHTAVLSWLRQHESEMAVNSIVLGEIEYGIFALPAGKKRRRLESWFVKGAERMMVIDFDRKTATAWAHLLAKLKRKGKAMPIKDSLVAATAIAHNLTVATRNIEDFKHSGVGLVNPFHKNG